MIDHSQFQTAIRSLGATLLLCVGGIIGLAAASKSIPDVLQNISVGALTGLVGLLVQKQPDPNNPLPVQIAPQSEPVITMEAKDESEAAAVSRKRRAAKPD